MILYITTVVFIILALICSVIGVYEGLKHHKLTLQEVKQLSNKLDDVLEKTDGVINKIAPNTKVANTFDIVTNLLDYITHKKTDLNVEQGVKEVQTLAQALGVKDVDLSEKTINWIVDYYLKCKTQTPQG